MDSSGFPPQTTSTPQTVPLMHPKTFPLTHATSSSAEHNVSDAPQLHEKETSALVEMLNRVDEFDQIPRIQVDEHGKGGSGASVTTPTVFIQVPVSAATSGREVSEIHVFGVSCTASGASFRDNKKSIITPI